MNARNLAWAIRDLRHRPSGSRQEGSMTLRRLWDLAWLCLGAVVYAILVGAVPK